MNTAEIVEMMKRVIGDMVGRTTNTLKCFFSFSDHAWPGRMPVQVGSRFAFPDHKCVGGPVSDPRNSYAAVMVKCAAAFAGAIGHNRQVARRQFAIVQTLWSEAADVVC